MLTIYMCGERYVSVSECRCQEMPEALEPQKLELQAVVIYPHGRWKPHLGPVQEEYTLLTVEPSLKTPKPWILGFNPESLSENNKNRHKEISGWVRRISKDFANNLIGI